MADFTTAIKASTKTDALRTTIPKSIVSQLRIEEGDTLSWQIQNFDGEFGVLFTKYESNTPIAMVSPGKWGIKAGEIVQPESN